MMNRQSTQILLATYNGEKYLKEQLDSIVAQTFSEWECLICDDCSTDGTLNIVREYCEKDTRFRLVSQGRRFGSASYSFLHLMTLSSADYVLICDQDDYWLPNKVEALVEAIEQESKDDPNLPICVFSDSLIVDSNLQPYATESFQSTLKFDARSISLVDLLSSNVVQGSASILNRKLVDTVVASSDFRYFLVFDWFFGALAKSQGKLIYLPEKLFKYRQHDENSIGVKRERFFSWAIKQFQGLKDGQAYESFMQSCFVVSRCRRILYDFTPINESDRKLLGRVSIFFDTSWFERLKILFKFKWFHSDLPTRICLFKLCFTEINW